MGDPKPMDEDKDIVVPLIAEKLKVGKQQVQTGGVRITKRVHEDETIVDEPGFDEEVLVERVPIDRVLESPAEIRHEGETMIVPVMEEKLMVEKRLILKEELRITRRRRAVSAPQHVVLRREEAQVERLDAKDVEEEDPNTP